MQETLLKDLLAHVWEYRKRLTQGCLLVLMSNILLIANPLLIRQAIIALDPYAHNTPDNTSFFLSNLTGAFYNSTLAWGLLLFLLITFSAYFKYRMRIVFISVSRDIEYRLQNLLFAKIQSQTPSFFDKYRIGDLLSRLTNDLSAYREVLGPGIMYPLYFLTMIFPAMAALFWIAPPLAIISIIPILILPLLVLIVEGRAYKLSLKVQQALGDMSTMAHETFSGIRIIKGYAVESISLDSFSKACKNFLKLNFRIITLQGLFYPFMTFLTKTLTVILIIFTAYLMIEAGYTMSMADFISFMLIQSFIFIPILMLGWTLPIYERGRAAYDRLLEIYDAPSAIIASSNPITERPTGPISFEHLSFQYPETTTAILNDITFEIPNNSFFGITGPIGSGKTTLLKLLNRDYEVLSDTIKLAGKDIQMYDPEVLQKSIATVEQMPFLFSRTIGENIAFGNPSASQDDIEHVAKLADLHDTILTMPDQYHTIVGENGVMLSGGQKQRVAIARALLTNRPILLFDDIFSAIDASTEQNIFQSLKKTLKNKTVIFLTHKTSVLNKLDFVVYMHDGNVIEYGKPQELISKEGAYAALAELQSDLRGES